MKQHKSILITLRVTPRFERAIKRESARRDITYSSLIRQVVAAECGLANYDDRPVKRRRKQKRRKQDV